MAEKKEMHIDNIKKIPTNADVYLFEIYFFISFTNPE